MFIPDPGSDFLPARIPDPIFFQPGSRIKKIPDPGSGYVSKYLGIFNPKNCYYIHGKMIWDVHPGARIRIFIPSRIPDPGVKTSPDPGSGSATPVFFLHKIKAQMVGGRR
jgi:hypothetical protein